MIFQKGELFRCGWFWCQNGGTVDLVDDSFTDPIKYSLKEWTIFSWLVRRLSFMDIWILFVFLKFLLSCYKCNSLCGGFGVYDCLINLILAVELFGFTQFENFLLLTVKIAFQIQVFFLAICIFLGRRLSFLRTARFQSSTMAPCSV